MCMTGKNKLKYDMEKQTCFQEAKVFRGQGGRKFVTPLEVDLGKILACIENLLLYQRNDDWLKTYFFVMLPTIINNGNLLHFGVARQTFLATLSNMHRYPILHHIR